MGKEGKLFSGLEGGNFYVEEIKSAK